MRLPKASSLTSAAEGNVQATRFFEGVKHAFPIVLGYVPLAFAYGVLAREAGLTTAEIVAMSIIVYAGSSQFIAVSLLGMGAPAVAIIFTTFLVNLRHLLLSASLVPYLRHFTRPLLAFIAYQLTDETFAVASTHYARHPARPEFQLGLNITAQVAWVTGSYVGAVMGNLIPPKKLGLDFALPAMFIALLVMQVQNRSTALVGLCAALLSLGIALAVPGNWNVILATISAASLGVILEKWTATS